MAKIGRIGALKVEKPLLISKGLKPRNQTFIE